jgi:hypothetical protein
MDYSQVSLSNLEGEPLFDAGDAKGPQSNDDVGSVAGLPQVLTGFGGPMKSTSWNTVVNAVSCGNGAVIDLYRVEFTNVLYE